MNTLKMNIESYLSFCKSQKCLDDKTIKAYKIDLSQFSKKVPTQNISDITTNDLELFIAFLHQNYKPKTAKRKIASVKAFYRYLEYKDIILINPFNKIQIKFRAPVILPKTIPLNTVECFLKTIYTQHASATTAYQKKNFRATLEKYLLPARRNPLFPRAVENTVVDTFTLILIRDPCERQRIHMSVKKEDVQFVNPYEENEAQNGDMSTPKKNNFMDSLKYDNSEQLKNMSFGKEQGGKDQRNMDNDKSL